jgi:hypothetical protein
MQIGAVEKYEGKRSNSARSKIKSRGWQKV